MGDTEHSGTTLATVILVLGIFTLAIYLLRMWFRITRHKFDISDVLLTSAVLCGIAQSIIWLVLIFPFHHGKLKAAIPQPTRDSTWPPKLLYMNQILFKLTTPLAKLSLCFLYRTMCATSTGRLIDRTRTAIWITIALIIGVYSSALLVSIFQCTPTRKAWETSIRGHCIDNTAFRYSTAVFNITTSVIIITLPIPVLMKLKHHRPEIKQLIGLVLLGFLHTSLTIARFVVMFFPDPWIKTEPQYGWVPAQTLAVAEMEADILFATLVVMRPAFQAVYHALVPRRDRQRSNAGFDRTNSVVESAIGRFRDVEGNGEGRCSEEKCILEKAIVKRTDVDVEAGPHVAREGRAVRDDYATEWRLGR